MVDKKYVAAIDRDVLFARRKGTRSIKLALKNDGTVRVSVPYGTPTKVAEKFLISKSDWIATHSTPPTQLCSGDHIGKSHTLEFVASPDDTIKTRVKKTSVVVTHPAKLEISDAEVQSKAKLACERALRLQAGTLLPQRLEYWSQIKEVPYSTVKVKKLKSRWGSCDTQKNIVLSIYLIQLDWSLIDYVILHELSHTHHPHHQSTFWEFMESLLPDYKSRRKQLKQKPTDIMQTNF